MIKKFTSDFNSAYSLDKAITTGYIFSLLLTLLMGYITYVQMGELKKSQELVIHTVNVTREMKEVQTSRRGIEIEYLDKLITGENPDPVTYDSIYKALNHLKDLIVDHPTQNTNVDKLKILVEHRKEILDRFTKLYKAGRSVALKNTENELQKSFLDIKVNHETMIGLEDSLLTLRTNNSNAQSERTRIFIIISTLLGSFIIIASLFISVKLGNLRNTAEENLRGANEDLDKKVKERTQDLESLNSSLSNEVNTRTKIEESLKRNEARLQRIFDTDVMGVMIADLDTGIISEANDAFLKMTGYTQSDLPLNWKVMTPPEELDHAEERVRKLKQIGYSPATERQFISKNGNPIVTLAAGALLPYEGNKTMSFIIDITKKKSVEREVEEVNKRLHLALRAGKSAEWSWDLVYTKVYWADDLYAMFGKDKETFDPSVHPWSELVYIEDKEKVKDAYRKAFKEKSNLDLDFRILRNDGHVKWLNLTGKFYTNELGIPTLMSGLCTDITAKKKSEQLIQLQNSVSKALNESETVEDILQNVMDQLCGEISFDLGNCWVSDADGTHKLKHTCDNNGNRKHYHPDFSVIEDVKKSGSYEWRNFEGERIKTAFGIPIYVNENFFAIIECLNKYRFEEHEELREVLISIGKQIGSYIEKRIAEHDLKVANETLELKVNERTSELNKTLGSLREEVQTRIQQEDELKKLYFELREMQKELIHSEKLTALGRFASGIAHEIRNPLANISSLAQFMAKSKTLDDKAKERLEYILININLANKIIKDLLQFASPDDLNFTIGNINKVLNELFESVKPRCDEKKVLLELHPDNNIPDFELNEEKLYSSILNFIQNAVDATNEGGSVIISSHLVDDNIEVNIEDTGIGIPSENLDKIFEPFFTTKDEGTGLGMGLAYSIVRSHGGDIKITSEANHGTTIKIILPLNTK